MRFSTGTVQAARTAAFIQVLRVLAAWAVVVLHTGFYHADYGTNIIAIRCEAIHKTLVPCTTWTRVLSIMVAAVQLHQLTLHLLRDLTHGLLLLSTAHRLFPTAFALPVLDVDWTHFYEVCFYAALAVCIGCGR